MSTKTTTSRKVLIPFATLVAAGAVAIGSGATFSSDSTDSVISATSGNVAHTNSDEATLTITDLKPGDSQTGTLTITNSGSLDSTLKMVASAPTAGLGDLAPALEISIQGETGTGLGYDDTFSGVVGQVVELGDLDADAVTADTITVTVTVTMADSGTDTDGVTGLDNTYQNTSAGLNLSFVTTQTSDTEAEQSGWDVDETP